MYLAKWLLLLTLTSFSKEECSYSNRICNCQKVSLENVVYEVSSKIPVNETVKSVEIIGTNYTVIENFLYPLQEKLAGDVEKIAVNHGGVERVSDNAFTVFTNLSELDLSSNKIKNISFVKRLPKNLRKLVLRSNNIDSVGNVFANLRHLKYVDLSSCKIEKNFDFTVFKYIYHLDFVNISNNHMDNSTSSSIQYNVQCIDISYNILSDYKNIPFSCYDNSYTSFEKIFVTFVNNKNNTLFIDKIVHKGNKDIGLEATNNKKKIMTIEIDYLDISFAQYNIQHLENLIQVKVLKKLILNNLNIPVLNKSIYNLNKLFYDDSQQVELDLSFCAIENIEKYYFRDYHLGTLNLTGNNIKQISDDVFFNSSFDKMDLSNSNIEHIEILAFNGLNCRSLNLSRNKLSSLLLKNISSIRKLDLSFNKMVSVDSDTFGGVKNLSFLDLSDNLLTSLGKSSFENLQEIAVLNLRNNRLTNIEGLFSYTKINSVDITFNVNLPLSSFKDSNNYIKILRLFEMNTEVLGKDYLIGLNNLEKLYFENSKIQSVDVDSLKGLFSLQDLDSRNLFKRASTLEAHTFRDLKSLYALDLSSLSIKQVEPESFVGLISLSELNLSNNNLNSLSLKTFEGLFNLRNLNLNNNSLDTLPLGIFTNLKLLETLDVSHNFIGGLETGLFSGLPKLNYLDLSYNLIGTLHADILFSLTSLSKLHLDGNQLITLDYKYILEDHPALSFVGISNNKWNCNFLYLMMRDILKLRVNIQPLDIVTDKRNIDGVSCTDKCDNPKYCDISVISE